MRVASLLPSVRQIPPWASVRRVIELDQGLLKLEDFFICKMDFFHNPLLLFFVFEPHRAVAWDSVCACTRTLRIC